MVWEGEGATASDLEIRILTNATQLDAFWPQPDLGWRVRNLVEVPAAPRPTVDFQEHVVLAARAPVGGLAMEAYLPRAASGPLEVHVRETRNGSSWAMDCWPDLPDPSGPYILQVIPRQGFDAALAPVVHRSLFVQGCGAAEGIATWPLEPQPAPVHAGPEIAWSWTEPQWQAMWTSAGGLGAAPFADLANHTALLLKGTAFGWPSGMTVHLSPANGIHPVQVRVLEWMQECGNEPVGTRAVAFHVLPIPWDEARAANVTWSVAHHGCSGADCPPAGDAAPDARILVVSADGFPLQGRTVLASWPGVPRSVATTDRYGCARFAFGQTGMHWFYAEGACEGVQHWWDGTAPMQLTLTLACEPPAGGR